MTIAAAVLLFVGAMPPWQQHSAANPSAGKLFWWAHRFGAGYLAKILFGATGLIPHQRNVMVMQGRITWNFTPG